MDDELELDEELELDPLLAAKLICVLADNIIAVISKRTMFESPFPTCKFIFLFFNSFTVHEYISRAAH